MAHITGVPDWVLSQEEASRGYACGTATACTGEKPDAAAHGGGHRALRSDQAGKCKYRILPMRAGHYADRFQDRAYGHRLQEDARDEVTSASL